MLGSIAKKIFGTRNDRVLSTLYPLVAQVSQLEKIYQGMSDAELKSQTSLFRERVENGESLETVEPHAYALVREASVRALGLRHFDVQILGGAVLHRGMISEMKTGEGKTLVATLAAYLNALKGKGVHVVTVNDYLARRDSEWMGRLYSFLGLEVGVVYAGLSEDTKRKAYRADITYGQNNEFGFDYLRDNMKLSLGELYQRGHYYAIVDEVDSILIDEARTPLIISGPAEDSTDLYYKINKIIPHLQKETHYQIDLRSKQPSLTEVGIVQAEKLLGVENLYDPNNIEILHHVVNALKAYTTMERDVDYVVKDGQVIIVDEFTGRLMPGRRWSNGLHQSVEAKEGVPIARENQTLASVTFQNYFRMYQKLAGMTGTADTESVEFKQIYNLEVVIVPTNRDMVRLDETDKVFRTRKEKYEAVIEDIVEINKTGQPVLVGTISIEQSESLSKLLKVKTIPHNVLNAKQHEREAEIVAQAGRFGSVTISTNMAGRGTDIVLGGNSDFLAQAEAGTKDRADPKYVEALTKYSVLCAQEKEKVLEAGGLFIMGTERHEARRIDNQLRGRAGRQGDPGCSRFYISLEDDLMLRFGGDKIKNIMQRLGWDEGVAIDGGMISRSIETAQKRVEGFHFESRKYVTEYDDVMNKQRQVVYNLRHRVLSGEGVRERILEMIDDLLETAVLTICDVRTKPLEWDMKQLEAKFSFLFNREYQSLTNMQLDQQADPQSVFDIMRKDGQQLYHERVRKIQERIMALDEVFTKNAQTRNGESANKGYFDFEQHTILETLDHFWNLHLQEMDHLREGIGWRGYGQKNPLHEYQREGFLLFQQMIEQVNETVVRKLFYYEVPTPQELLAQLEVERVRREKKEEAMQLIHQSSLEPVQGVQPQSVQGLEVLESKDPEDQRARLLAEKKARRKMRK